MGKVVKDFHGNVLFTSEWVESASHFRIVIDPAVKDVTGMSDLIVYSTRAQKELAEFLSTMMADTGH